MLSLIVFLPLAAALVLVALPRLGDVAARWAWVGVTAVDLALVTVVWLRYESPATGELAFEERAEWIPGVNSSYHLGVDGLSLPLIAMTAVIFVACAVYALRETDRPRLRAALFLFLQSVSMGRFRFEIVNVLVTLGTGGRPGILRGRAGDFKERVARNVRQREIAVEIWCAGSFPSGTGEVCCLVELIVAGWTVPRDIDAIGGFGDTGHDRAPGKPAGLCYGQVRCLSVRRD